jgi:hypothetical protein
MSHFPKGPLRVEMKSFKDLPFKKAHVYLRVSQNIWAAPSQGLPVRTPFLHRKSSSVCVPRVGVGRGHPQEAWRVSLDHFHPGTILDHIQALSSHFCFSGRYDLGLPHPAQKKGTGLEGLHGYND